MINTCKKWLTVTIGASVLVGCASLPETETQIDNWQAHQAAIMAIDNWALEAKAGVRDDSSSTTLSIDWQRSGINDTVKLTGPLGQGRAELTGRRGRYQLSLNNETYQAASLSELGAMLFEPALPLDEIGYWVRGVPAPGAGFVADYNELGLLGQLDQAGWTVLYQRYQGETLPLPSKLTIRQGEVTAKIVVRSWQ